MKSTPARTAWAPAWCDRLSTNCSMRFRRRVGLPERVPNDATPAMLTAGPTRSVGGAFRSPYVNCARVSLTVRFEIVHVLPNATAWSTLSSPADAEGALSAPAPRALSDVTRYSPYLAVN